MKTYIVMVRILGGEWARHRVNGVDLETLDLAVALGMKATIIDPIRECMVVSIDTLPLSASDYRLIHKVYELVE